MMSGMCECGCGNQTAAAKRNDPRYGHVKGKPLKFIRFHSRKGSKHQSWSGGRIITQSGRVMISAPWHPRASSNGGYVFEHILVVESVIGRKLKIKEQVHHLDGNPGNNAKSNLALLEGQSLHNVIHARMRVVKHGGKPSANKICCTCRIMKTKQDFCLQKGTWDARTPVCRKCTSKRKQQRKERRRENGPH